MDTSICWICQKGLALTGEHMVKKSDLKRVFGRERPKKPLHLRRGKLTQEVADYEDRILTFETKICGDCNGTQTQKHDNAWMVLSKAFGDRTSLKPGDKIKLVDVFRNDTREQMILVQLYFVKVLGCAMRDAGFKVDLQTFSDAIKNGIYHPHVYLSFGVVDESNLPKLAGGMAASNGEWGGYIYAADPITVSVVARSFGDEVFDAWNPRYIGDEICIQAF